MQISVIKAGVLAAAFSLLASPMGAWAQAAEAAQSTFDTSVLAATCFNCHGTEGRSPGAIPSIAGRPEAALRTQLLAFKAETPPAGTTIMDRLAKGYSNAEIEALARYFSQIKR